MKSTNSGLSRHLLVRKLGKYILIFRAIKDRNYDADRFLYMKEVADYEKEDCNFFVSGHVETIVLLSRAWGETTE